MGAGDRTGGGQTLGQARLVAQACGLLRAVRLADELAARAGLGPPRPDGGGEDGAAGDGAGALVAGEQLFISDKTASVHVSAILRKLGASTRTQAAARARNVPG
ncbi:DNA-binding response regulator [Ornithinimicrobium avium]|uniref:DNA-binding response regulator n=1 Tax=Ornithinimicrobium avium TaxID=2283195 RepID=A0A345NST9_9MICO|nr:DNA-binding response regulator [Ornithinimicrobium avium]